MTPHRSDRDETRAALLRTYDDLLRTEAEMHGTLRWDRDGPLYRAVFAGGSGFVTYRDLARHDAPEDGDRLDALIQRTVAHFEQAVDVESFEWKTRGHDQPTDLGRRLEAHGLVAGEPETVMLGEAAQLAVEVPLPAGVVVRRVGVDERGAPVARDVALADVERMQAMQLAVFGAPAHTPASVLVDTLLDPDGDVELWVAEAPAGTPEVLSAGRLDVLPGTGCAGLWGGATIPAWRGQGLYRALVAARARSALARGVRLLHSDCTELSRPILERSGLVAVTTTTPYVWTRAGAGARD
jgi:GNAT superfamily N-acetyltransferase